MGLNTSSMAFIRICLTRFRYRLPCANARKSSANTSTYSRGFVVFPSGRHGSLAILGILVSFGLLVCSSALLAMSSRGCELGSFLLRMKALAMSALVSVAAQNAGGEFTHPMGRTKGKAKRGSSPSLTGKTTPSFGMSSTNQNWEAFLALF